MTFRLLFITSVLLSEAAVNAAGPTVAFSMSIEEFRARSADDQKARITGALEHRLRHARNIRYEALMLVNVSEARDGEVIRVLKNLNGSRLRHWVLGDSFRMDTIRGGPEVTNPEMSVACGFDAATGIVRSTVQFSNRQRSFGRVCMKIDRINDSNRYAYWLDGKSTLRADHIIRYLVDHRDEYTIQASTDEAHVRISVPWYYHSDEAWGTRSFRLDAEKGFLPVYGFGRWEHRRTDGSLSWRSEEFFVEDSLLVGDVWMPTRLKEVIGASSFQDDSKVNVYNITVSQIEAGTVKPEDLHVPFLPGMEVVDAIKDEGFVVGPDGARTQVKPLGP